MMKTILTPFSHQHWDVFDAETQKHALAQLESDHILLFPQLSFSLEKDEEHLLSPVYSNGKSKNISFSRQENTLKGLAPNCTEEALLKKMLLRFSEHAEKLICHLLPRYQPHLQIGRTSYRPVETEGRKAKSYKKDDTRLHVDAFPSSPVQGRRILRVFSNIHPTKPRIWHAGEPFQTVVDRFMPQIKKPFISGKLLQLLKITKSLRTPYDHMMLQLHDRMKKDEAYQRTVAYETIAFPAQSTWIVQTDSVSHAALSGQFLLEQTFYLPLEAMQNPEASPQHILASFKH